MAFSDTEGSHRQVEVPNGDILIFAGDISRQGSSRAIADFNAWLALLPHPEKVVIAGNHDTLFERNPGVGRLLLTGCRYLQDEAAEISGLKFWGSPHTPEFYNWAFNLPRGAKLAEKWAMIPKDTEVLVTHGPPFGVGDRTADGPVGCDDLRKRVEQLPKLKLHVFGHIHEEPGIFKRDGVVFANVSWRPGRAVTEIEI